MRRWNFVALLVLGSSLSAWGAEGESVATGTQVLTPAPFRSNYGFRLGLHPIGNVSRTVTSAAVDGRNVSVAGDPLLGFGAGLSVGWNLNWIMIESGTAWERRSQRFAGVQSVSDFIQIPLMAYIRPLSWFSFGAGVYYGYRFSRVLGPAGGTLVSSREDGGMPSNHDAGLMLGVRFEGELSTHWGLYGEARGAMSVFAFESIPGVQDRWEAVQLLVGLAWYP